MYCQKDVGLACQLLGRLLPQTGGQADGVHHLDLGLGEALPDEPRDAVQALDRLRGLGRDAKSMPFLQTVDVLVAEHHIVRIQVFRQAANLDVAWLSNDNRMAALGDELLPAGGGGVLWWCAGGVR